MTDRTRTAWSPTSVVRFTAGAGHDDADVVAHEEPLEIQLGATPLAVVMRTPGHDAELALGFLWTERVISHPDQVVSVRHCGQSPDPEAAENVIRAVLAESVEVDWESLRRNLYASSSCGICGKATIENALATAPPLNDASVFQAGWLSALPGRLEAAQEGFARTGGLHAAALFGPDGELRVTREDVGRHNAVDKVLGASLRAGQATLAGHTLLVSGRISFEIVQKAVAARVPLVAGVSAPTSLAVDLAREARVTLLGFLRGERFNVYGETSRVRGADDERDEPERERRAASPVRG